MSSWVVLGSRPTSSMRRRRGGATFAVVPADDPSARDGPWSDGDLARGIAALPSRDARALESELCARFARRVYLYGLRHLREPDLAFDLSQDVMARVIERLRAGEVREPDRVASFVLGTARVMAHDERRRARRRSELASEVLATHGDEHATMALARLDLDRLQGCLGQLSERERSVVVLSFCVEESAQEIGEALALAPGNVRVIRHRALARLQRCMGLEGDEGREESSR